MAAQSRGSARGPGDRPIRLDSLKNPQPRPLPRLKTRKVPDSCPNPECACTEIINEDSKNICKDCGTVISEDDMVTDVQYGLGSVGNHVIHGKHVGNDQAYNKEGDVFDRHRAMDSEELTNMRGKKYIQEIVNALGMEMTFLEAGCQVFKLASSVNFIQGRRTKSVAAVALYIACRTQQSRQNKWMLIDFSDILNLNVFHLGDIYKTLIEVLRMNPNGHIIQPINPEALIHRFASRLEFGEATMRVSNDATRIVQRMDRDWMTPGRRPAGICGAALVLAARMNNFRRTVREVVYIVKVQEATIFKRLDEFKLLESSGLTVEQFRNIDLERFADPPAFYEKKDGGKKRGRKRKHLDFDDDGDNDQPTVISSRATSTVPSTTSRATSAAPSATNTQEETSATIEQARLDSESMPPPPLPIDPNLLDDSGLEVTEPVRKSVPPSIEPTVPASVTADSSSNAPPGLNQHFDNAEHTQPSNNNPRTSLRPPTAAPESGDKKRPRSRRGEQSALDSHLSGNIDFLSDETQISGLTDPMNLEVALAMTNDEPAQSMEPSLPISRPPIPMTADISDAEFADDPEVSNCLLTAAEVEFKTRIWTHENKEYLRAQQAKELKYKLAEANGTLPQIKTRTRRRKRIGDLRPYLGDDFPAEGSPVAETPEKAVEKLVQIRGFSKKLNYSMFSSVYGQKSSSRSPTESIGGSGSPGSGFGHSPGAGSPLAHTGTVSTPNSSVQQVQETEAQDKEADESGEQATAGRQESAAIAKEREEVSEDESEDDDGNDGGDDDPYDAGGDYSE